MPTTLRNTDILFNDGTTQSTAATGSFVGFRGQAFTSNGTFTIPAGITAVKVTVVGGGGSATTNSGGGGGGAAISFLTGLTPGNTLAVTVGSGGTSGNAGGTSSVASGTQSITTISATGGAGGSTFSGAGASGGIGSNGTLNIRGGGASPYRITVCCAGQFFAAMPGGSSILGGGGQAQTSGGAFGGGGGSIPVANGAAGVVIFEW